MNGFFYFMVLRMDLGKCICKLTDLNCWKGYLHYLDGCSLYEFARMFYSLVNF